MVSENQKKITIEPVTRVEGHGKVTILLDDDNKVTQARLHIVEFRGFERFIQGRPFWEVPVLVQRLCGICPVSHHLAAAKAMDMVVGVDQLTPTAEKMRRLMHYGQTFQSHALHFFHLASPDLLFGFDADVAIRNVIGVAAKFPDLAVQGVMMRKYGQEIIKATAGKKIQNRQGLHRRESRKGRAIWLVRFKPPFDRPRRWRDGPLPRQYPSHRQRRQQDYRSGRPAGLSQGYHRGSPPLVCDFIDTPEAEAARKEFMAVTDNKPNNLTMAYHWTRMIELLHSCEKIKELLNDPDLQGEDLMAKGDRREEGIAIIEAPRGTLFHHYKVNEDDQVTMANLIVSTTSNNVPMNLAVEKVAKDHLSGVPEITEGLLNHVEVAIRAYDPCLSCATHALGKMPLVVTLKDPSGKVLDTKATN